MFDPIAATAKWETQFGNFTFSNRSYPGSNVSIKFPSAVILIGKIVDFSSFYLLLPLSILCLTCEILTLLVFCRSSFGITPTTRVYYISIACGELVTTVFKEILYYVYGIGLFAVDDGAKLRGQWTPLGDVTWCPLTVFLWSFGETVANNALLAFTAEVVVASYIPLRAKMLIRKRNALTVMSLLVVEAALVNMLQLKQFTAQPSTALSCGYVCVPLVDDEKLGATLFVFNNMLPALGGLVLTALIVHKIRHATLKRVSRLDVADAAATPMRRGQLATCITLVCMSVTHFLFCLPLTVFRILYALAPMLHYSRAQSAVFVASIGLVYMVHAPIHIVNFVIYCRRVPRFAANAFCLISCRQVSSRSVFTTENGDNQSKRF